MSEETKTARDKINDIKTEINKSVNTIKKLNHEMKKLKIQQEYNPTEETAMELEILSQTLAETIMAQEDLVLELEVAEETYNRTVEDIKRKELEEMAESMEFDVPDTLPPINQASLIAAMAQNLQFGLITGEGYLARLNAECNQRRVGEDTGGTAADQGEMSYDAVERFNNMLHDRDLMRASMISLKKLYEAVSEDFRAKSNWWPPFLRQSDNEVRQASAEREINRQRKWAEEQKNLRTENNKMVASEFRTI